MRVHLAYGVDGLDVDVPSGATIIQPTFRPAVAESHAALVAALRAPTGGPPLREIVRRGQRVAISVCDITRAQPRRDMLAALFDEMPAVRDEDVVILIATGTHRPNTPDELLAMLGPEILRRYRVINHDCRDPGMLGSLGVTSTGVPILLNRHWLDADVRITTGFVEPHFFAGFSGGPKMVAPGLAGLDTVLVLHDARRIGHPNATWGVTEGNPIHDDVREIAAESGVTFALDVTLNRDQKITAVFAGDLFAEHRQACRAASRDALSEVPAPFDVVLTTNSGYPLDQNLYQAVKGMSAAAKVVKPGGTIICAAECRDGLPAHGPYGRVLASRTSPDALLAMIRTPGYAEADAWQVQIQAQVQTKARVLLKNSRLPPDAVRAAHLEPIDDVAVAVTEALAAAGLHATLCVLPEGPQTIPFVSANVYAPSTPDAGQSTLVD
jgi:nickel-dependent lactate racemase